MTTFTLDLDDMAFGGDAVGHCQGKAVFVPLALPGETVRVAVESEGARLIRARLVEVLAPAPERVAPPCRHFGICGGCQWQHIRYDVQLAFKQRIVTEQLRRIGNQARADIRPVLPAVEPWAYRNHVQLAVGSEGQLGFQALRSHDIVPIEECWISHPLLDELWDALEAEGDDFERVALRAGVATGEQLILFEGRALPEVEIGLPLSCLYQLPDGSVTVLAGDGCYHEVLGGRRFRVSGPSFFQVNTAQAERLVELVRERLQLRPHETLLDVYCGVGTFALSLVSQAAEVIGIESSPWAIRDAAANAEEFDNVSLVEGGVEDVLPELDLTCDAVVLDPPRAGCELTALQAIAATQATRIVYVSCDPATLARDVARLAELGYALVEVQPLDMFPQTYHVECVALMSRVEN